MINKVMKDDVIHDINDKRIPEIAAADVGKFLSVDENGNIKTTAIVTGTKLYHHRIELTNYPTVTKYGINKTSNTIEVADATVQYGSKNIHIVSNIATPYTYADLDEGIFGYIGINTGNVYQIIAFPPNVNAFDDVLFSATRTDSVSSYETIKITVNLGKKPEFSDTVTEL